MEVESAYTLKEASELTGCPEDYLLRKITSGQLKAVREGTRASYRIPCRELERWWRERGGDVLGEGSPVRAVLTEFSDQLRDAETAEDLAKVEALIAEKIERRSASFCS